MKKSSHQESPQSSSLELATRYVTEASDTIFTVLIVRAGGGLVVVAK